MGRIEHQSLGRARTAVARGTDGSEDVVLNGLEVSGYWAVPPEFPTAAWLGGVGYWRSPLESRPRAIARYSPTRLAAKAAALTSQQRRTTICVEKATSGSLGVQKGRAVSALLIHPDRFPFPVNSGERSRTDVPGCHPSAFPPLNPIEPDLRAG